MYVRRPCVLYLHSASERTDIQFLAGRSVPDYNKLLDRSRGAERALTSVILFRFGQLVDLALPVARFWWKSAITEQAVTAGTLEIGVCVRAFCSHIW